MTPPSGSLKPGRDMSLGKARYFYSMFCCTHKSPVKTVLHFSVSTCSKEPGQQRVKRWAFGIDEVLKDPVGREQFLKFLESEFSSENLRYIMKCIPLNGFWYAHNFCKDTTMITFSIIKLKLRFTVVVMLSRDLNRDLVPRYVGKSTPCVYRTFIYSLQISNIETVEDLHTLTHSLWLLSVVWWWKINNISITSNLNGLPLCKALYNYGYICLTATTWKRATITVITGVIVSLLWSIWHIRSELQQNGLIKAQAAGGCSLFKICTLVAVARITQVGRSIMLICLFMVTGIPQSIKDACKQLNICIE